MKFLSALFGFVLFVVALVFALSNRQAVSVSLWPFDLDIMMPVYLLVLGSLALGLLFGGAFIWLNTLTHRFAARRLGKDVVLLSDKVQELEREVEQYRARSAETAPLHLSGTRRWQFWRR